MPQVNLTGIPWFLGQVIERTLANPKCSSDACLLLAEAMEETAELLPAQTIYRLPTLRAAADLRAAAPAFANPPTSAGRGKPLGDFDGTLTP
jgi:hypothetical protein